MSRYLTPSKIGLLALVALYCDSAVPNRAIIPTLSFVTSQLAPSTSLSADITPNKPESAASIENFTKLTANQISNVPGRSLLDLFLKKLWAIDSLDALHGFFHGLNSYLVSSSDQARDEVEIPSHRLLLSRVSPFGIFVRRAQLEFIRMQFHDTVHLWISFLAFRSPTEAVWRKRNPTVSNNPADANLHGLDLASNDRLKHLCYGSSIYNEDEQEKPSSEDVERVLEYHLDRLQRLGNRIPQDMKDKFSTTLSPSASTSNLVHFVSFFDAWRAGDYTGAFESLHRYFDYTTQTRDKSYYQYALLHMAILQADFGCFSEAIAAMNETIATARENQDVSCLNFSLSWLNHLSKAYPMEMKRAGYIAMVGSEKEGFDFLKSKAIETKTWNLLSSTLLSQTKLTLAAGDGIPEALEHLYQSSHLNMTHHINSNVGTQLLLQSSVYGRLGLTYLADAYCEILMDSYATTSPVEDAVRASCRRAYTATQSGMYEEATVFMGKVNPTLHRTLKLHQYHTSFSKLLRLKLDLRRRNFPAARYSLHQLESGASSEPELDFQTDLLEIQFLQAAGSFSAAFDKIEDSNHELRCENADVHQHIHLLVLKCLLLSRVGKPIRGFTMALRAAAVSYRAKLLPALWESVGAMANILSSLCEYGVARRLLDAVIPQALGGKDAALCAQLYLWQADALAGLAGQEAHGSNGQAALLSEAEGYIDRADYYFTKIQDIRGECDTLGKKATIARKRGDLKLAQDWAERYVTLYQEQFEHDPKGAVEFR
ncbi:hypothetical protein EJ08DRAFT_608324 [Tothia fuscella]|uniref:Anaphase-promoting complex subunit 5 n=1 Tax=Tothia fuscella TaxID=1048955 RepID=A0A9P4U105_9PEZI|nr:hypothetical protein EJ08DRAFT_608324 [Tothia fuscella]